MKGLMALGGENGGWYRSRIKSEEFTPRKEIFVTIVQSGKMTCTFLYISMSIALESKNDYLYSKAN